MRKLIYLSTLLLLFVLPMMAQHPLFPTPAKVQNGKGSFVIGKNLQVQGNGGYADKLAAGLQTELKEAGLQSSPASGTIRLELTNDCKMADEAYTLVVEPNSILLQASSEAGLFYAKQTFHGIFIRILNCRNFYLLMELLITVKKTWHQIIKYAP